MITASSIVKQLGECSRSPARRTTGRSKIAHIPHKIPIVDEMNGFLDTKHRRHPQPPQRMEALDERKLPLSPKPKPDGAAHPLRRVDSECSAASMDMADLVAAHDSDGRRGPEARGSRGGCGRDCAARRADSSECSSTSMDMADLLAAHDSDGRRRRSVESSASVDLADLRELATSSRDGDDDERSLVGALAERNQRRGDSWADFSVPSFSVPSFSVADFSVPNFSPPFEGEEGEGPRGAAAETPRRRQASALWADRRQRRSSGGSGFGFGFSWSDLDDGNDAALPLGGGFGGGGRDDAALPKAAAPEEERRGVRFSRRPHAIYDHPALADMTPSEKRSFWYDERDHESIQLDIVRSLNSLHGTAKGGKGKSESKQGRRQEGGGDGDGDGDNEVCLRGLEDAVRDGCWIDTHRRTNGAVVRAVLEEQEALRRSRGAPSSSSRADDDPEEAIASVSRALTKSARDAALAMGRSDAAVAAGVAGLRRARRKVRTSAAA